MHSCSNNESGRSWAQAHGVAHRFAPMLLVALGACIADQGSSRIESDAGPNAADDAMVSTETAPQDGDAIEAGAQSVTRKVEGLVNDAWVITDENGKPGPDGPGILDVPANAKVHFILTSDPSGEAHTFQIAIPNYGSADVLMPAIPASGKLDWTAPPTPNRYKGGIICNIHKGMTTDIVVQP